jgi:opine dehydrogenase
MKAMPNVTVCGCGSGGLAMAADLAMMGCRVTLYEIAEMEENLDPIRQNGGITLTGRPLSGKTGLAKLHKITADPQEAVEESELIFVNIPAMPVVKFMQRLAPHLTAGQTVVVTTGYWATLRTRHALDESDIFEKCTLVDQNIMPYLSEKVGPAEAHVSNFKNYFRIAALPANKNEAAYAAIAQVYPQAQVSQHVLENNLQPGNPGVHAQITLPKAAFFFDRARVFRFYAEVSRSAAKLAEAFDRERMRVAEAFGCRTTTWIEYCRRAYGYAGDDLYDMHIQSPHAERWSTDAEARRLLVEDLCYFFVPLEQLAAVVGVEVPVTTAMIELLTVFTDFDYRGHAITLADLGLEGLNREQIIDAI